jgi:hypothetical protein
VLDLSSCWVGVKRICNVQKISPHLSPVRSGNLSIQRRFLTRDFEHNSWLTISCTAKLVFTEIVFLRGKCGQECGGHINSLIAVVVLVLFFFLVKIV